MHYIYFPTRVIEFYQIFFIRVGGECHLNFLTKSLNISNNLYLPLPTPHPPFFSLMNLIILLRLVLNS